MQRCGRCVLSDEYPGVAFDADGVCNYCAAWDERWGSFDAPSAVRQFTEICESVKRRHHRYNCLVPFSGGRDSSYVLYLAKVKFGLHPLAVTFNNGFFTDEALSNIHRIVQQLGCGHILHSPDWEMLRQMYATALTRAGEFCSICSTGIRYVTLKYQRAYRIPLILTGTAPRVDEGSPFEVITSNPTYVRRVLHGRVDPSKVDGFMPPSRNEWGALRMTWAKLTGVDYLGVNLPDHTEWDNKRIQETLERELGWKAADRKKDHIDCRFAPVKDFLKERQLPGAPFKQGKLSNLVRDGQISRQTALLQLEESVAECRREPENFQDFLNLLEVHRDDVLGPERKSHLDFIRKEEINAPPSFGMRVLSPIYKLLKQSIRMP